MNAAPQPREGRGLSLLALHCKALDPYAPTARDRLEAALGPELTRTLLFALCSPENAARDAA
jgi:hypothetical protein